MNLWPPATNGPAEIAPDIPGRLASIRLPLARLLQLLIFLQTERYPNARRLAEACAVSRRTIYRDLATLEAAGIRVLYRPDHQGYQLARECLLQPLQLDDHEALALLILSRSSRPDVPFGLARHAQSALAKVVQALPPQLRTKIMRCGEILPDDAAPNEIGQRERRAIDETILNGLIHRKVLRLHANDPDNGEAASTQFAPFRVAKIAGRWSLIGYSSLHGCARIVDLRSIQHAEATEEAYSIPPRFRLERLDSTATELDGLTRRLDARLRFKESAMAMMHDAPDSEDCRLSWAPGGEFELSLRIALSAAVVSWILGFGELIEVIRPAELRDAVRKQAERIALHYGRNTEEARAPTS
jgi:predicted DNA-binding transcriptional regulator YafY